jgi:hypothetical protein
MRQAYFRDAGATYGDILYLSRPADWKFQTTTPDPSSLHVYFNFNTRQGPVVLDVPPAVGASLCGSLLDAWQMPLGDVGEPGADKGRGGKYLLLPPDWPSESPAWYIPLRCRTYNGHGLLRAVPETRSDGDRAAALRLVKQLRLYPYNQARNPPVQRHIDISGRLFDCVVRYDDTFFESLARMLSEEPVNSRDQFVMSQLKSIGIERGKPFRPDGTMREILYEAIYEVQTGFQAAADQFHPIWSGSHWGLHIRSASSKGYGFLSPGGYAVDEQAIARFLSFVSAKKASAAVFHLAAMHDREGRPLRGETSYRLRIPARVPVGHHWAVTAYDLETASFIRRTTSTTVESHESRLRRNPDGSVDVYFAPRVPAEREGSWIATSPGKRWFALFRFYGPEKAVFDQSWSLPDIEKMRS